MKKMMVSCLMALSGMAFAGSMDGVNFPDNAKVAGKTLIPNGAGFRQLNLQKMYLGVLYLPEKTTDASVAGKNVPKKMVMILQKPMPTALISSTFYQGVLRNLTPDEIPPLKERLEKFKTILGSSIKEAPQPGDVITVEYVPGKGIHFQVKNDYSEYIEGEDFAKAVYNIWLGPKPVEENLKASLLKGGV